MDTPSSSNVTQLLIAWGNGDKDALDQLMPLVYDELHRMAARQMRGTSTCQVPKAETCLVAGGPGAPPVTDLIVRKA